MAGRQIDNKANDKQTQRGMSWLTRIQAAGNILNSVMLIQIEGAMLEYNETILSKTKRA